MRRSCNALLAVLFAPATWLFQLQGFSVTNIEALRFSHASSMEGPAGAG